MNYDQTSAIAAYYVRMGLALVPIARSSKVPTGAGWQHPENLVRDEQAARAVFAQQNIGVHLGASGLASLDVDDLPLARTLLANIGVDLDAELAGHPCRIVARGVRLWYRVPDGVVVKRHPIAVDGLTAFEVRGGDVQDVAPGSLHPNGQTYCFEPAPPRNRAAIPEMPTWLLDLNTHWDARKRTMLNEAAPEPAPPPTIRPSLGRRGDSVIDAFNAQQAPEAWLLMHGYQQRGERRFLSPHSTSGDPGVVILDTDGVRRVYCHHGADPLTGEHTHDAFGVYTMLEHGGDVRAAVKAAAAVLGMEYTGTRTTLRTAASEDALTNWAQQGERIAQRVHRILGKMRLHHAMLGSLQRLAAYIYMEAAEGRLATHDGQLCVMVGGANGLAASLGGRPCDWSTRSKWLSQHGALLDVVSSDPTDPKSALMFVLPESPDDLPILTSTPDPDNEGPNTVGQRQARKNITFSATSGTVDRTPTPSQRGYAYGAGGASKSFKNPLRGVLRTVFALLAHPGLTPRILAKRAGIRLPTLRRHLAVLTEHGLHAAGRLTCTLRQFHAAVQTIEAPQKAVRLAQLMGRAQTFARQQLRAAHLGLPEMVRVAPARKRLLMRATAVLAELGVAA